jgi:hypothetical protein
VIKCAPWQPVVLAGCFYIIKEIQKKTFFEPNDRNAMMLSLRRTSIQHQEISSTPIFIA